MPLTEAAGVYRPRHPERTVVYRLFEEHFERYVREYEERYAAREGSLRNVVPTTLGGDFATDYKSLVAGGAKPSDAFSKTKTNRLILLDRPPDLDAHVAVMASALRKA